MAKETNREEIVLIETLTNDSDDLEYEDIPDSASIDLMTQEESKLTEAKRQALENELEEVQKEIQHLRQKLQIRVQRARQIQQQLGLTVFSDLQREVSEGFQSIKQSSTFIKTAQVLKVAKGKTTNALSEAKDAVTHKLVDVRNSETYKTMQMTLGTAYTGVKDAIKNTTFGPSVEPAASEVYQGNEAPEEINSSSLNFDSKAD